MRLQGVYVCHYYRAVNYWVTLACHVYTVLTDYNLKTLIFYAENFHQSDNIRFLLDIKLNSMSQQDVKNLSC